MFLIDTDIIIYSLKNHPAVVENFRKHDRDPKAISVITYGELAYGAMKSSKKTENLAKVRQIAEIFPVIEVTQAIMDTFGMLKSDLEKKGRPLDDFDLIIAATALSLNYTIVTNNQKHFEKIPGLTMANWVK